MKYISAENIRLAYEKQGGGERTLFVFHGFGQTNKAFANLFIAYPPELYTIYRFDLFFHGQSVHPEKQEVRPFVLKHMIGKIIATEGITEFEMVCYSIGAIYSVAIFMLFPEKVRSIRFIAPDGFMKSNIFELATSKFGQPFFKYFMRKPYYLIQIIDLLLRAKIISKSEYRFLNLQLKYDVNRKKIMHSWINFKPLKHSFEDFKNHCYQYMPSLTFYLGEKDNIIKARPLKELALELPNTSIVLINSGHQKMISETIHYLTKDQK